MPQRVSTVRGRELGEGVRAAIQRAGLSGREVAGLVGWDPAKVSDLVNGKGGTTEIELAVLLGACKTPMAEREHLLALHRESTAKDWFQQHGARLPVHLRTLIQHEKAAMGLVSWQMNLVHGLLQTPDYMSAIISSGANMPENEVAERVARMVVWRKRSFSASQQACVEIGRGVGIRDSKTAGQLPVRAAAWSEVLTAVKAEQRAEVSRRWS